MLGLTSADLIALAATFDPVAGVLKTLGADFVNGQLHLNNAIVAADLENTPQTRAARLALRIQSDQPFRNANTRTATASIYLLLTVEGRARSLNAKAYQAYGMVGHHGPLYAGNPAGNMFTLSAWIASKIIGSTNPAARWNTAHAELIALPPHVLAIRAAAKNGVNNNNPLLRAQLMQRRSWRVHNGY